MVPQEVVGGPLGSERLPNHLNKQEDEVVCPPEK